MHANSTLLAATLNQLLGRLDHTARSTGLIRRNSKKFSAEGFLLTLFHAICRGSASFRAMASQLAGYHDASLTQQSLHQRFHQKAIRFLQAVLKSVLMEREVNRVGQMRFERVLVQDSTQLWMNRKNSRHYRAVANSGGDMAGAKLDLIMDLQSGQLIDCQEVEAYTQDRSLGPRLLDEVRRGDLVIHDLGYFDLTTFQRIEQCGAHWISRLHGTADARLDSGEALEELLRSTDQPTLDLETFIAAKRHRVRLVAIRLPQEIANRRRQQKKDKRGKNKISPKKGTLIREAWNLYVTNLSVDQYSLEELVEFYEQRWQIAIQFRAIKQSTQVKKALGLITNRAQLQALAYAAMIFAALTVRVYRLIANTSVKPFRLKMERTSNWLSQTHHFTAFD